MTMRYLTPMAAIALATGCANVAADDDPIYAGDTAGERSCFFPRSVSGFQSAGRDRIIVRAAGDDYLFETFGGCPDLDFSWELGLETRTPGTICRGYDVDLIVPRPGYGVQRCPVRMIRKLTEEENE
ncbi:MAG: DUF6491 family protein [Parasphingopyxis sp.]|uniref:DUF6491 family protein n=1 Tax=Parasphingopyxis sp. TaxID=1920299 RepID=UPI0032EA922B